MPSRTAKFVSAIFASLLASAPLTTVSHSAPGAADDCFAGPKGQAPQGAHWYYRVERSTKRHCWYLADQRTPRSQTAAANSPTLTKPPPPQDAEAAMQQSVANAHAELPAQTRSEPASRAGGIVPASSADAVRPEDNGNATASGALTPGILMQRSVVATRWPDPYSSAPEAAPSPVRRDPGASVTSASQSEPTSVLAAGPFVTADVSSATPLYLLPLQLAALAGVLALVGFIGTMMFKFGRSPRLLPSEISNRRGHVWESTDDDRIVLSRYPEPNRFARGFNRGDRATEFFAQISRRTPT
ncbi:hypothetical protein [Bradyrhizobium sp. dw_411]|uniref:hypothetical protein n=1 Tax=Bradyrhizobium sp. dw_411 TaxID=2720082 RepID=UPI001BCA8369|nr:hypothetical protein [Bradyrhizobium sp. dw_411]